MYLIDDNWLSNKPKMENRIFLGKFRDATKARILGLSEAVVRRVKGA